MKDHISYSEFKDYCFCPYLHKLKWDDNVIPFDENEFLIFGKTIHKIAEMQMKNPDEAEKINWDDAFDQIFIHSLTEYKKNLKDGKELKKDLIVELRGQGKYLARIMYPEFKRHYGEFEVLSIEEELLLPIENMQLRKPLKFKGFIDLVFRTLKDNKIHIVDWKTSTAGWYGQDRNDKMKLYQLIYYKIFYAQKHNVNLEDIETSFVLLKRAVRKDHIEPYDITSGQKRIDNALALLQKTIGGIQSGRCWKSKYSCQKCYIYDTNYCSGANK